MKVFYRVLFCTLLAIIVYGFSTKIWTQNLQAKENQQPSPPSSKQVQRVIKDKAEAQRVRFKKLTKGMEMLRQYGVKFDPSLLTLDNWPVLLKDDFDSMPEFKRDWYARGKIGGVIIANNVYLDEYVEATSNTFILARNIISEGTTPTIVTKGYDLYYYPIESGTIRRVKVSSLDVPKYHKASYNPMLDILYNVNPMFIKAGYAYYQGGCFVRSSDGETTGVPGTPVSIMQPAPDQTAEGTPGAPGNCSDAGEENGKPGDQGPTGPTGSKPGKGGRGGKGQNAGALNVIIQPADAAAYTCFIFYARGATGGVGAFGRQGQQGGKGGRGGRGGDGANCCIVSRRGDGGPGGQGGIGGTGGNGGDGGEGGEGGDGGPITITKPSVLSSTTITTYPWKGDNGQGGYGGAGGDGGPGGAPGAKGDAAQGGCNIVIPTQNNLGTGPTGNQGPNGGNTGGQGDTTGADGEVVITDDNGAGGNCWSWPDCSDQCLWNDFNCNYVDDCTDCNSTPIILDIQGNGYNLTDKAGGVLFDIAATGTQKQIAWTATGSDDAFLVLDRNGNGRVDNGVELFGSATPQSPLMNGEIRNGFRALAEFDKRGNGGNEDGKIDQKDSVFASLRLWQDTNHNGLSEANELRNFPSLDIESIDVKYKDSKRVDEYGNLFRFRGKVDGAKQSNIGKWAYDVFLIAQ